MTGALVRRSAATLLLALALASCREANDLGAQIRETVEQGVDRASEVLANADEAISGATRSAFERIRSGVEGLQSDIRGAGDLTGDRAREAYQDLLRRAQDLREQAESASGEARAEARAAWERVRAVLEELERDLRNAVEDL
jgi:polyhydroxyalkanoate synthesis regulator phasin